VVEPNHDGLAGAEKAGARRLNCTERHDAGKEPSGPDSARMWPCRRRPCRASRRGLP